MQKAAWPASATSPNRYFPRSSPRMSGISSRSRLPLRSMFAPPSCASGPYRMRAGTAEASALRGPHAAELPVAAERGRDHLFGPRGLRADVVADRHVAFDDEVPEDPEALDL